MKNYFFFILMLAVMLTSCGQKPNTSVEPITEKSHEDFVRDLFGILDYKSKFTIEGSEDEAGVSTVFIEADDIDFARVTNVHSVLVTNSEEKSLIFGYKNTKNQICFAVRVPGPQQSYVIKVENPTEDQFNITYLNNICEALNYNCSVTVQVLRQIYTDLERYNGAI